MKLGPNLQAAEEYLNSLGGDVFVFQTFTDNDEQKQASYDKQKAQGVKKPWDVLAKVLTGTFEQHRESLAALSIKGAGVFVQANRGSDRGKGHITGIRSLFVDLDDPKTAKASILSIQKFMPKPTAIVNSSVGKYHIYWKVLDCPLENFKKMQVMLATRFNTDLAMGNLDRVMRVPGFYHQKGEPTLVTATIFGTVHTIDQLYAAAAKAPSIEPATKEVSKDPRKKMYSDSI